MKTIAWDVDDVLNGLMHAWFTEAFLPAHPGCVIRYEELRANPPHDVLGIPLADYLASLDAFRAARQASLAPQPEVLAWFERRGASFRHIAVTATPLANSHRSAEWVLRHFGRWIRTITVLPSHREGENVTIYDATKAEHLAWLGKVSVLVDDTPKNLVGLDSVGIRGVLFPQPWGSRTGTVAMTLAELDEALA